MRGSDQRTGGLFSYVGLEARIRADHPRELAALRSRREATFTLATAAYNLVRLSRLMDAQA